MRTRAGRASSPGSRWPRSVFARAGRTTSRIVASDGDRVQPGDVVLTAEGPVRRLLTVERTMLNLLCHLSGIATLTARWVDAVAGTGARIRDTRKTTPGLRALEKYAVRCGGGVNHRMGLSDAALVKDNHVAAAGGVAAAFALVRKPFPGHDGRGRVRHRRPGARGDRRRRRPDPAGQHVARRAAGLRRAGGPGDAARGVRRAVTWNRPTTSRRRASTISPSAR